MTGAILEMIDLLARLPGIGRRSATRLVFHLLDANPEYAQRLGAALCDFHNQIERCSECANMSDQNPCPICTDHHRDDKTVCVVENIPDLWAVDSGGTYRGKFHVLHGLLSPLDGIGPDDLNVDLLIDRIKRNHIGEVIVATRPSVEGEATAMLIRQSIGALPVKVTRIASGVPLGSELEYADARTLERALQDRKEM
ncbi:MAG: recombination protein RecR [Deltaproteobacteria bacterium]|nr:recombination protein RecR [Deltaproteobacteria bacterium]MBN2671021.1 recombination protein RecR [Deltaproteobacteria bacterium]